MRDRDLLSEFGRLQELLRGVRRSDDNGPILTVQDVVLVSESAEVIVGRIRYVDERTASRPHRTSDFDYEACELGVDGPEEAADLLLVNLDEEVLAMP